MTYVFDIIDGRNRNSKPCGQLFYDDENQTWNITIDEHVGTEDVPFLFVPFIEHDERSIGNDWASRWVQERVVPASRQNLGEVLRAHNMAEYNEFELLSSSKGVSSQDYFVLRGPFAVDDSGQLENSRQQFRRSIGEVIANTRRNLGLTQKQLAEKALVDQAVISRIERGQTNVTADLLSDIAAALDMQVEISLTSRL